MGADMVDVQNLILRIHSAALDEDAWGKIGGDVARTLGADGASLVRPSQKDSIKPWCRFVEYDESFLREYMAYWGRHDVWYQGAVRTGRIGVGFVNLDSQLIERHAFQQSPFYNDFLKRLDIDRMVNVCLLAPDADYGATALSLYRGPGKEPFSLEDVELLSGLAPHLSVAAQNFWAAQSLRLAGDVCRDAVDSVAAAVLGIDAVGRVAFTNKTAEDLIRQKRWIELTHGSLEPARSLEGAAALAHALRELLAGTSFRRLITDARTGAQAIVAGAPVTLAKSAYPTALASLVWLTPIVPDVDVAADLADLFGLTFAERRLVGMLIKGDDLRAASEELHVSLHTARTQLKSIFRKTDKRSQAELLAFAMRLAILRTRVP